MTGGKKAKTMEFGHDALEDGQEAHWEVLERILFIYAKLNPGQGYVQGMNEIIGPLYHAFAADKDLSWRGKLNLKQRCSQDWFFSPLSWNVS